MKDLIRMNQLAGVITEGQARKISEVLNEVEENSILLGYMLLWKGIPSKIILRSEFDKIDDKVTYTIVYKNKLVKSDLSWILFKSQEEIQNLINSLKGETVASHDWRNYKQFNIEDNLDSNSFKIVPVTVNW
jgi:hypothetical protein